MTAVPVAYETWLVLLSIVMAIQGAYVGLSLAVQVGAASGMRRRLLLAGAAFSLAVAIWTMHFVGMLAVRVPFQVDYLVFPTLLVVSGLRDRGRGGGLRDQFRTPDVAPLDLVVLPDGRRHFYHALHRHERAQRQRVHDPRAIPMSPPAWRLRLRRPDWRCGSRPAAADARR